MKDPGGELNKVFVSRLISDINVLASENEVEIRKIKYEKKTVRVWHDQNVYVASY